MSNGPTIEEIGDPPIAEMSYIMRVITSPVISRSNAADEQTRNRVTTAANRLYAAECAFHDAHQTHVDAWILAASQKLHDAIAAHLAAVAATSAGS
jgi:hypothetical protein